MAKAAAKTKKTTDAAPAEVKQNKYEAMFLFGAAAAAEVDKSIATARGILEKHGGAILVAKKWDERKLSYEIGKHKRGLYVITYFTAPGSAIAGIERDVNLSEEVVRVLVTDADHLNEEEMNAVEPQPIVREERPSWERGGFDNRDSRGGDSRGGDRGFDRGGDRGGDRGPDRGGDRAPRRDDRPVEASAKD